MVLEIHHYLRQLSGFNMAKRVDSKAYTLIMIYVKKTDNSVYP